MQNLNTSLFGKKIAETQPGAYTAFLQAKNLSLRYTKESADAGLKLIDQSLAIDSSYAPSWLLKSKLHFQIKVYTNDSEASNKCLYAAEKAISLNPDYAEAYAWLGKFSVSRIIESQIHICCFCSRFCYSYIILFYHSVHINVCNENFDSLLHFIYHFHFFNWLNSL